MSYLDHNEPIAWLHESDGRVDVIHADAKDLWKRVRPAQVEHYTVPLYAKPTPLSTEEACALIANTIGVWAEQDGHLLKLLHAVERAHGVSS